MTAVIETKPTNSVALVPLDVVGCRQLADDPRQLESHLGVRFGAELESLQEIARQCLSLYERSPRPAPWTGYLIIDPPPPRQVVGTCAFAHAPQNGAVEIAYFTFPPYEGRGVTTAAAAELTRIASPLVRTIFANTLPKYNASTRVLQKNGFTLMGEIMHPDDGRVWRWELPVQQTEAAHERSDRGV